MVILPDYRAIFIHIPRTSGVAISNALVESITTTIYEKRAMHTRRCELDQFAGWHFFSVMRNPWELFASHFGWVEIVATNPKPLAGPVGAYCREMYPKGAEYTIRECMAKEYPCEFGGWWETYGGDDVEAIRYEEQPYVRISEIVDVPLDIKRENMSKALPRLSAKLIDEIAQFCYADVTRFRYSPPAKIIF